MDSNIQKIQNELKQKELDYKVVKILYKHTPYYVVEWLTVGVGLLAIIIFCCAIIAFFIYPFIFGLFATMGLILFYMVIILNNMYHLCFNEIYFNLKKLNIAINEIKNMNNNHSVLLTNHKNNIQVLGQMMKQSGSVTYGDVKEKYYEIKDELSSLKAKLNDERVLNAQKDLLN